MSRSPKLPSCDEVWPQPLLQLRTKLMLVCKECAVTICPWNSVCDINWIRAEISAALFRPERLRATACCHDDPPRRANSTIFSYVSGVDGPRQAGRESCREWRRLR